MNSGRCSSKQQPERQSGIGGMAKGKTAYISHSAMGGGDQLSLASLAREWLNPLVEGPSLSYRSTHCLLPDSLPLGWLGTKESLKLMGASPVGMSYVRKGCSIPRQVQEEVNQPAAITHRMCDWEALLGAGCRREERGRDCVRPRQSCERGGS